MSGSPSGSGGSVACRCSCTRRTPRVLVPRCASRCLRVPPLKEVRTFQDGATLDLPGSPRVIHMPGHTPGSAAIHVPSVDAVFVGDAITTHDVLTGELGPRLSPFTLDRAGALASLERLEGIEARWVLPGHGEAWDRGVADAVRAVRAAAAG
jgi:glyoxylase-like metal-dependent hydrolase (beta-lactamase superfamily II)